MDSRTSFSVSQQLRPELEIDHVTQQPKETCQRTCRGPKPTLDISPYRFAVILATLKCRSWGHLAIRSFELWVESRNKSRTQNGHLTFCLSFNIFAVSLINKVLTVLYKHNIYVICVLIFFKEVFEGIFLTQGIDVPQSTPKDLLKYLRCL